MLSFVEVVASILARRNRDSNDTTIDSAFRHPDSSQFPPGPGSFQEEKRAGWKYPPHLDRLRDIVVESTLQTESGKFPFNQLQGAQFHALVFPLSKPSVKMSELSMTTGA